MYPCKEGFHVAAPRHDEAGSQLGKRLEDETPFVQARMRDMKLGLVDHLVAVEEKVEVERPRAVPAGDADAAVALLDGEQPIEELRGEGDEPQLTAEALAERIGEPFRLEDE